MTTSIGVAVVETLDEAAVDPERLVQLADEAMCRANTAWATWSSPTSPATSSSSPTGSDPAGGRR